ncbi:hypothetical protein [Microbulbifer thermotolerans]|uniref:hypothetical protein n=1 Tax=Microbulbifer thermotolerans TaxID=252514 RepID=UPI00224A586D|nr:hypothetical protein [Microbulbifer thermotolerans]MCX2836438.1 hypothetical protein [Microbulbifer thermotolerans]
MSSEDLKNLATVGFLAFVIAPLVVRKLALDILCAFYESNYPGDYWLDYVEKGKFHSSHSDFEKILIKVYLRLDKILIEKIKSIPILVVVFSGFLALWLIWKSVGT